MTEISDNTPCVAGGWRGVRDALAKRDRFRKFLTKGRPNGVMLPYAGSGQKLRYYFLDLTIKTNRLSLGFFGRIFRVTTKTQCHQGYDRKPRSASARNATEKLNTDGPPSGGQGGYVASAGCFSLLIHSSR